MEMRVLARNVHSSFMAPHQLLMANEERGRADIKEHSTRLVKQHENDIMYEHQQAETGKGEQQVKETKNKQERRETAKAEKIKQPFSSSQQNKADPNLAQFPKILQGNGLMTETHQESIEQLVTYLQHKMNKSFHPYSLDQQLLAYGSSDLHKNDMSPPPPGYDSYYQQAIRNIAHSTAYNMRRVGLSQKSQNCSKVSSREELGDRTLYFAPKSELCESYDLEASLSHREILTNVIRAEIYDVKAVTLVTHLSEGRVSTLEKLVQHWRGK